MPSTIVNPIARIKNSVLQGEGLWKNHDRNDSDVTSICLVAYAGSSNNYATPRKLGVTSGGYVVPSGKIFLLNSVKFRTNFGGANTFVNVGSASTDVGFNSSSGPSNPDSTSAPQAYPIYVATASGAISTVVAVHQVVTAGRYLYCYTSGVDITYVLFGYEIDDAVTDLND